MRPDELAPQSLTPRFPFARYALRTLVAAWIVCIAASKTAYAQPSNFDLAKPQAEYLLSPGMVGSCPVRVAIRPAPWLLIRSGYCPIVVRLSPIAGNVFLADGYFTIRFQNRYGTDQQNATIDIPVQAGQPFAEKELLFNCSVGSRNMQVECDWNGVLQNHLRAMFYVSYSNVLSSEFNQRLTLISDASSEYTAERKTAAAEIKKFQIPISLSGIEPNSQPSTYYWKTHFADVSNLPKDWLHIAAFDQIYSDIDDLERLEPSSRETLKDFIWCGGTLVVGELKDDDVLGDSKEVKRLEKLFATKLSHPFLPDPPFRGRAFRVGFGKIALNRPWPQVRDNYSNADELRSKSRSERLSIFLGDEYWNWLIPEVGKTPVWTFFAFVVLVVGVAAPGILYWSQRVKRRVWIVLAIPALALVSTTSLFLYGALKDGWGSIVRVRSLTWVNSEGDGAAWSRQSYFAGNVPGNRLHIAANAEIVPLKSKRDVRSMQYQSDTEQVYSGLMPLRQQKQFSVTHPIRNLRVFQRAADIDSNLERPHMINALDCKILGAVYCDAKGQIYQSAAVPAGEPMVWEASTADAAREYLLRLLNQQPLIVPDDAPDQNSRSILEIFGSRYRNWYQPTGGTESFVEESRWRDALTVWGNETEGKFVVFVDQAPHVERCLPNCKETSSLHTIVGQW